MVSKNDFQNPFMTIINTWVQSIKMSFTIYCIKIKNMKW